MLFPFPRPPAGMAGCAWHLGCKAFLCKGDLDPRGCGVRAHVVYVGTMEQHPQQCLAVGRGPWWSCWAAQAEHHLLPRGQHSSQGKLCGWHCPHPLVHPRLFFQHPASLPSRVSVPAAPEIKALHLGKSQGQCHPRCPCHQRGRSGPGMAWVGRGSL